MINIPIGTIISFHAFYWFLRYCSIQYEAEYTVNQSERAKNGSPQEFSYY